SQIRFRVLLESVSIESSHYNKERFHALTSPHRTSRAARKRQHRARRRRRRTTPQTKGHFFPFHCSYRAGTSCCAREDSTMRSHGIVNGRSLAAQRRELAATQRRLYEKLLGAHLTRRD